MGDYLVKQVKGYALGNFIMLTPTIRKLYELRKSKIDVFFEDEFVKKCFIDCDFINIVDTEYKTPDLVSSEINKIIPDYKNIFIKKTNNIWDPYYHTYVDDVKEIPKFDGDYILFLNGLGGLSLDQDQKKPHWYGKKEIDVETFKFIKNNTNLPIYFTGSKSDIFNNPWIEELCDKIFIDDIRTSLGLIRDANKIISNDTGLSHCAAAMNKDILILWKDTPFVKNVNPGNKTWYSKKEDWLVDIIDFLNNKLEKKEVNHNKFVFIIPSFNRFNDLVEIIETLLNYDNNIKIITINDGSDDKNYKLLKNYDLRVTYLENETNFGKKNYWKTVNKLLNELKNYDFTHCVMLNDDLILKNNFYTDLNKYINDKNLLRLFTPKSLIGQKNWGFDNWVDGIFCAPKYFFKLINFKLDPIEPNKNKNSSSGVGKQFTQKINNLKLIVDFYGSILEHNGNDDSKMHPEFRILNPLISEKNTLLSIGKKNRLLSIIIPTYKNTNYIDECIDSVIESTKTQNVEVLVGIDGCKETLEYVKQKSYPENIKFYYFEKNVGPYVVKNSLSEIATGENLLFFDSDDIMTQGMVSNSINSINHCDFIRHSYINFTDPNKLNENKKREFEGGIFTIKKQVFEYMNGFEPWKCEADSEFALRMSKSKYKTKLSNNLDFFRRIHNEGLTSRIDTGYRSKLRAEYRKLYNSKTNFGPLPKKVTEPFVEINVNRYSVNSEDSEIPKQKNHNLISKLMESTVIDVQNIPEVKTINYDSVNEVLGNRIIQKQEPKPINKNSNKGIGKNFKVTKNPNKSVLNWNKLSGGSFKI